MDTHRALPLTLAASGLLMAGLALWRADLVPTPSSMDSRAVARLEPAFGEVHVERDGRRTPVTGKRPLQRLEIVDTGPGTEAVLIFPNGEEVRILENSTILSDLEGGRPVLIVKNGDLWIDRAIESADSVLVSRDGVRRPLAVDQRERLKNGRRPVATPDLETAPVPERTAAKPPRPTPVAARGLVETLTAEYIQETIRTQRNLFFKCYGQLLQRTPGVSGEASLAFTIERSGHVSTADVASSSLQDPQFRRCLTEAVKRIEFKSFAGDSVQTLFPIRFE